MTSLNLLLFGCLAYLIGSVQFGVLISRALGRDVRGKDFPGVSGMVREFGWGIGVGVLLLDFGKGAFAAWVLRTWVPDFAWFAPLLVGVGHCWPVFFGFRGGQGLAPMGGATLFLNANVLWPALVLGACLMLAHKRFKLERFLKLRAVPFASLAVAPAVVLTGWWLEAAGIPLALALLALVLRGSQVLSGSSKTA
jgi:acyl phosphate:glycerol-3-phosphate acyltransferase